MPRPAPQHRLPLLLPPSAHLCCATSRSWIQSLFIFLTHDLWHALRPLGFSPGLFPADPDHAGPAPSLITHQDAPACRTPSSLAGPLRLLSLGNAKMEWSVEGKKGRYQKFLSVWDSSISVGGVEGCRLAVCRGAGGKVRRVGVECQNTKNKCGTLPFSTPLVTFKCITRNLSHERWDGGARYIRHEWPLEKWPKCFSCSNSCQPEPNCTFGVNYPHMSLCSLMCLCKRD